MFSAELGKGGRLQPHVHLDLGGLGQRFGDLHRPQPARGRDVTLLQPGGEEIAFEVAQEQAAHARPDHLDRDLHGFAVAQDCRRMHLRDRGRGDRLAEALVELADRPAERALDGRDRLGLREGLHAVLQQGEIERDVVADDVRPRRQELAELDIGWAEPRDRVGQPLAAAAAHARCGAVNSRATRQPNFGRPASWSPGSAATTPSRTMIQPARNEPQTSAERTHAHASVKASSPNAAPRCRRNSCAR